MVRFFSRRNVLGQRRWYFNIRAKNGEILCQSEAYNSRDARMKGLAALHNLFREVGGRDLLIHNADEERDRRDIARGKL